MRNRPNCLILIDYMGPNIQIGRKLKRINPKIPIYYYIAPQEWAWRVGNNATTDLVRFSDKIFAIFKQEASFYKRRGGNVLWIGHPMIDLTKKLPSKRDARAILKLRANQNILLIMPASRPQELRYILPTFLKAAKKLQQKYPTLVVYIPSCRKAFDEKFRKALKKYQVNGKVISKSNNSELKPYIYSLTSMALCKSGTVNMELALNNVPQIVGYKVSKVTAFIAKQLLRFNVEHISPVNLLLRERLVPELVQDEFTPEALAEIGRVLLEQTEHRDLILEGYKRLRKVLGDPGVTERAAKEILDLVQK